jgi:hypothetical protein
MAAVDLVSSGAFWSSHGRGTGGLFIGEIIRRVAQGFYDQLYLELALKSMMFVRIWKRG